MSTSQYAIITFVCSTLILASCTISGGARAKYDEGTKAWELGDHQQALKLLKEAVEDSPEYYEAHLTLGEYYHKLKDYQNATSSWQHALFLDKNPNIHILLGNVYIQRKLYRKSEEQFKQALSFSGIGNEQLFAAHLGLGICNLELDIPLEAEKYLDKAMALNPEDPEALFQYARLLEKKAGPNERSVGMYKRVLEIDKDHLEAMKQLGNAYKMIEDAKQAVHYYKMFVQAGGKEWQVERYLDLQENGKAVAQNTTQQQQIKHTEKTASSEKTEKTEKIEEPEKNAEPVRMICPLPECNRFGKKGQISCDFDGTPLVPYQPDN